MRGITETLNTHGNGLWSKEQREVTLKGLSLNVVELDPEDTDPADEPFGELRVHFDPTSWDTQVHGLIYTDKGFMDELKDFLTRAQYDVSDIGYSEAGMQGDDYVSLDVGAAFINSWNATK